MHEIKNLTNSPYDLETANGSVRLPAMGSIKEEFSPGYLEALKSAGMFVVTEVVSKKPSKP
jgi:hypothetical protein